MDAVNSPQSAYVLFTPVVLVVVLILLGVLFLIAAAIAGKDHGVLRGMSETEFARGLITYLFAVVTIGTAVVLLVFVLTGGTDPQTDARFQQGKEILSLLLGVFGTVVGFYFGSEVAAKASPAKTSMQISPLRLSNSAVRVGDPLTVSAVVSGGRMPVRYAVVFGTDKPEFTDHVGEGGWIVKEVSVPPFEKEPPRAVRVVVEDAEMRSAEQRAGIAVSARN